MKQTNLKSRLTLKALILLLLFGFSPALAVEEIQIERRPAATPEQGCQAIKALRTYSNLNPGNWIGATVAAGALAHAGWKLSQSDLRKARGVVNEMVDDVARAIEPVLLETMQDHYAVQKANGAVIRLPELVERFTARAPKLRVYSALLNWDLAMAKAFDRVMSETSGRAFEEGYRTAFGRLSRGQTVAVTATEETTKILSRSIARDLVGRQVLKASKSALTRAAFRRILSNAISSSFKKTLGGAAAAGFAAIGHGVLIDMLLFPSELGDGTWAGAYAENPMLLVDGMTEEEACRWAKLYPKIGASAVALHEAVLLDSGDALVVDGSLPQVSEVLESKPEDGIAPILFSSAAKVTEAQ